MLHLYGHLCFGFGRIYQPQAIFDNCQLSLVQYVHYVQYSSRPFSSGLIFGILFIGPESDHCNWLCLSLTHSLTNSHKANLIDVTLACVDAYSKLVEVVTVADVSDEDLCWQQFVAYLEAEVWS